MPDAAGTPDVEELPLDVPVAAGRVAAEPLDLEHGNCNAEDRSGQPESSIPDFGDSLDSNFSQPAAPVVEPVETTGALLDDGVEPDIAVGRVAPEALYRDHGPESDYNSTIGAEPWLIALDIDGTLVDYNGHLSDAVRDAVIAAEAAGHQVVLASGRDMTAMQPVVAQLGITNGWMVCSNGCVIVRLDPQFGAGYWIEQVSTFDAMPILRVLAERLPHARFAVEDVGRGWRVTKPFNDGELAGHMDVVPFDQVAGGGLVCRVVVRGEDETPEEFNQIISELGLGGVSYFVGYNAWMDFVPDGVTKSSGLEHVREKLGIPPTRTMAVGDGHNDIDMLQWAARGVAMGQADLVVRMAADEVTAPVTKDGVAQALRPLLPKR